ncbi:hypothetical protein M9H77_11278 [Catharanthus roseus]|uniref:Uncharacterized protein n=1 Tax=Catharanthus roseus TaxID=4058 RepID=A0ACC0BE57_CATRO|nr:hypothetical protein M9H77_11278 [Catharanthus roseus]
MKSKCFKWIKDAKQRKHGKGSNKIDKTHDFDSDVNSISTPDPPNIPETLDPLLEGSDEEEEHPEAQAQALRDYQLARDRVRRAEYIAATEAIKEAIWLQGLLNELHVLHSKAIIYTDSQSCLHYVKIWSITNGQKKRKRKLVEL